MMSMGPKLLGAYTSNCPDQTAADQ